MRRCLCVTAGLFFGFGAACGDLSDIDDNRIRKLVKTAKKVIIEELMADGNTQSDIDNKIGVIVEALQGNSGGNGGTPPLAMPLCRETGRKTVVMFRDPSGHIIDLLNDDSGFWCEWGDVLTVCSDGEDVCECEANDTLNPDSSTSYAVTCTEDGGDGQTFNFTAAETLDYETPSNGGGAPPGSNNPATYSIKEQNQNEKLPGIIFPITVVNSSGTTITPAAEASLSTYDSSGGEVDDAIARWTTVVGENIYEIIAGAGDSASFRVFLVRDTSGVARIGGTVDGTPINHVTLTAGAYSGASDILAINDTTYNNINFLFSGTARTKLNSASKSISYVVTDANGEVQTSETVVLTGGADLPIDGGTFFAKRSGSCVVGEYVLIRIGDNTSKVYLSRCRSQ